MRIRFMNRSVLFILLALVLIGTHFFDSAWAQTGTISGRVTNTTGTGLPSVSVRLYDAYGGYLSLNTPTDSNGYFSLSSLTPGYYKIYFQPTLSGAYYVPQWYNNRSLSAEADLVTVTAGQTTPNINAELADGGRLAGNVTGCGLSPDSITVKAYNTNFSPANTWRPASSGNFNMPVPPGTYKLQFDPGAANCVKEFYNNKPNYETADPVPVLPGQTNTLPNTAQLDVPQTLTISGCVRDGSSTGIPDVVINGLVNSPKTGADGCYTGTVSYGWGCYTGRITPAKGNYALSPPFKDYSCVNTTQSSQNYTAGLPSSIVYYDQFPGPLFDPQKWETSWEFVREIQNNQLVSKTAAYGSTVQNRLYFKNPEAITYFEADVTVNEVDGNYGPIAPDLVAHPQAGLLGVYYNDGTGTTGSSVGDVSAQVRLRPEGGQLISEWRVVKYTAPDASAWTVLLEKTLSSSLTLGSSYKLSINWDQTNRRLTFSDGIVTDTYDVPGSENINSPRMDAKMLRTAILIQNETNLVTEPALWGRVSATFDKAIARAGSTVVVNDGFSTTWIDANNWDSYEFVREIRTGELVSKTRSVNSKDAVSNYLYLANADHVNEIQAKVTLAAYQNPNKAFARARLAGYFFNDTGDPNSGYQGETLAIVEILGGSPSNPNPSAQWTVLRFNDPDGAMWQWTVHQSKTFPTGINPGESHLLGLKWDGVRLAFKLDDSVDYYIPFTPIHPSNKKFMQFGTQIMPAADSVPPYDAYILATLDDVRIGVMNLLYLPLILKN